MARKSRLMSMTGGSEYDSLPSEKSDMLSSASLPEDEAGAFEEGLEADYDADSDFAGAPESPDVEEPMMGINSLHREALQQADLYYNPVMDNPEVEESERDQFNAPSDPYAQSMGFEDPSDLNEQYRQRMMFKDDIIQTLQGKAKTRALATAKFQKLATEKK